MPGSDSSGGRRRPARHQTEAAFRLLIDSVQEYAIFILDPKGFVASWNPGAQRLKGYTADEILGEHFSRFYPPDKPRREIDRELEIAAGEGPFREEGWRVRKDGSRFWADVTITAMRDSAGALVGFAKVTRDITGRKSAEEQTRKLAEEQAARLASDRANRRLQALFDVSRSLAEAGLQSETVANAIVKTVGELVGEICVLRLVRNGRLEPVAAYHKNPELLRLLQATLQATSLGPDSVISQALRAKVPVVETGPDLARITAERQPDYSRLIDAFPPRSILAVPLVVPDGQAVGVLSLARSSSEAPYSEDDKIFVESLARVSALALSNAKLYVEAKEAHDQLRLIFQGIAEGIIVQSANGRIVLANDIGAQMCGFPTASELMATPIAEVLARFEIFDEAGQPFPPDRLPARLVLRGADRAEAVLRSRARGSQTERWSLSRATSLRDKDGQVVYAISVFEDITDRRRALEHLRFLSEAGELLGSSLDYAKTLAALTQLAAPRIADWCTVDVFDERGRVQRLAAANVDPTRVEWAAKLNERYPVALDQPVGVGAVMRTGRPELTARITDEMLQAGAQDPEQLRVIRELGLRSYICVPLVARNRIVGALTLLTTNESGRVYDEQDLAMAELLGRRAGLAVENARLYTETQAALRQVTEISRVKDEFLATLSHELRTPLNAIVGWAHMLKTGRLDGDQVRKGIETIDRNAALQSRLIADILDTSRIVTGKLRLNVQSVYPVTAIQHAIDTIRPAADAKGVTLESILDPAAGPISGDAERLQQILWNLLSNALKFVPKGGRVEVRLEAVKSRVEIVVADNGPGIEEDFLPHVFEPFRQADSSTTRAHGGLGLGLTIVRHLVELHGGEIRAANHVGHPGAVFTILLPRRAVLPSETGRVPNQSVVGQETALDTGPSLAGIRVMLLDDEKDARDLLGTALQHSGASVTGFDSVDAALAALPAQRPHVVLADIEMPGKDGYAFMQEVRRLDPSEGGLTPAIAITAYARVEDRIRALAAGFDLHIAKPVQLDELTMAVARLAGNRR